MCCENNYFVDLFALDLDKFGPVNISFCSAGRSMGGDGIVNIFKFVKIPISVGNVPLRRE